jgi:hypothetical protein
VDGIGEAALWLSDLEDREVVATNLFKLAEKLKSTGRATSKLEAAGKNAMGYTVSLYDQLETKLQGFKSGKYNLVQLLDSRDNLQREVMRELETLHKQIEETIGLTDGVYDLSRLLGKLLTKEKAGIQGKHDELRIQRSSWNAKFRGAIQWDGMSKIQRESITRDLALTETALNTVDSTKSALNDLTAQLDGFFEAVGHARKKNTRMIIMGLDVEDLLRNYHNDLEAARRKIDGWD